MQAFPMFGVPMHPFFNHLPTSPWQGPHNHGFPVQAHEASARHFEYKHGDGMEKTDRHPGGRYTIIKDLGSGAYGKVMQCKDAEGKGADVAVKAVRADPLYRLAAQREVQLLQKVGVHPNICKLIRSFEHKGHVCVVQEMIPGFNLHNKLRNSGGYSLHDTQGMAKQLLNGLAHIHKCDILHTDIKTENMMIEGFNNDGIPQIKIIDLGSAISRAEWHPYCIGTPAYRSPEAILQAGWDTPADVWALGCSIFEIFLGHRLFDLQQELTQLHVLEAVMGKSIPSDLMRRGCSNRNPFNEHLLVFETRSLAAPQPSEAICIKAARPLEEQVGDARLLGLLKPMLAMDPVQRASAKAMLAHNFFSQNVSGKKPRGQKKTWWWSKSKAPKSSSEYLSESSTVSATSSSSPRYS